MQKLNEIRDKNPFKVPENYFEEVNRKIISVTSGNAQEVKKIRLYNRFKPYLLIAASVTGIIMISYSAIKLLAPDKTKLQLTELINPEFSQSYINDIDVFTLEENASLLVLADEVPDVNKSDIIDYLLKENIEITDIYEHL